MQENGILRAINFKFSAHSLVRANDSCEILDPPLVIQGRLHNSVTTQLVPSLPIAPFSFSTRPEKGFLGFFVGL